MYKCNACKSRFVYNIESQCAKADSESICPYCGSRDVKKRWLLNFFKGILSSGGG